MSMPRLIHLTLSRLQAQPLELLRWRLAFAHQTPQMFHHLRLDLGVINRGLLRRIGS